MRYDGDATRRRCVYKISTTCRSLPRTSVACGIRTRAAYSRIVRRCDARHNGAPTCVSDADVVTVVAVVRVYFVYALTHALYTFNKDLFRNDRTGERSGTSV